MYITDEDDKSSSLFRRKQLLNIKVVGGQVLTGRRAE
jgi:hypothetical protein